MKLIISLSLIAVMVHNFSIAGPLSGNYSLAKEYTVTIDGTSNLHAWNETVKSVTGNAVINANGDGSFDLESINIAMIVRSIKSDMGAVMNNNTYKALKADYFPQITFALTEPVKTISGKTNPSVFTAKGNLTIAGVTKVVEMQVKLTSQEPGKFVFEGSQTVIMTDYGIDPPTALFGTLKTGKTINIVFKTSFISTNNP